MRNDIEIIDPPDVGSLPPNTHTISEDGFTFASAQPFSHLEAIEVEKQHEVNPLQSAVWVLVHHLHTPVAEVEEQLRTAYQYSPEAAAAFVAKVQQNRDTLTPESSLDSSWMTKLKWD